MRPHKTKMNWGAVMMNTYREKMQCEKAKQFKICGIYQERFPCSQYWFATGNLPTEVNCFTSENLATGDGTCYFWHEDEAGHRANEIVIFWNPRISMGFQKLPFSQTDVVGRTKNYFANNDVVNVFGKWIKKITLHFFLLSRASNNAKEIRCTPLLNEN